MIPIVNNDLISQISTGGTGALGGGGGAAGAAAPTGGASFSDALKNSINEVSRLQEDASNAVDAVASGKSDDMTGVMTAMEKSDLAFKTLLSIRSKLLDAYDEIKSIPV